MLISGGECSILSVWRPQLESESEYQEVTTTSKSFPQQSSDSKLFKNTSKLKNTKNKLTPY